MCLTLICFPATLAADMLDIIIDALIACFHLSADERGQRSWSGAFILLGIVLAAVGVVWLFIWLVGTMVEHGHA